MNANPSPTAHRPPLSLAQQEARQRALARFEQRLKDLTGLGNDGPIVTGTEVELIRRKYTTVDGALAALEALARPRLAYQREQAGAVPQPALSEAERTAAQAHFAKMREARAEAVPANPPAATPRAVPANGLAAPVGHLPAPDSSPGYATDAITYVDADGFGHVLTVYAPTPNEALRRGRQAVKALQGMESVPQAGRAPLNGHEAASPSFDKLSSAAPVCPIHKKPMQKVARKNGSGSFWSCHTKLDDDSWCPYKPPSD